MNCAVSKAGGWRLAQLATRYRRLPGGVLAGARHRSLNQCTPAVSPRREYQRTGSMPAGFSGLPPMTPLEMPSDSTDTLARSGTVTATLMARNWPGRTVTRGPLLDGEAGRPLTVAANASLNGTIPGHDAPAGQRGDEEQPPIASTPARTTATRPARNTGITSPV